jgi:hypothetical protein
MRAARPDQRARGSPLARSRGCGDCGAPSSRREPVDLLPDLRTTIPLEIRHGRSWRVLWRRGRRQHRPSAALRRKPGGRLSRTTASTREQPRCRVKNAWPRLSGSSSARGQVGVDHGGCFARGGAQRQRSVRRLLAHGGRSPSMSMRRCRCSSAARANSNSPLTTASPRSLARNLQALRRRAARLPH